jgi:hypothetical protein
MYNELRKYIDNQKSDTPCGKMVGTQATVNRYAKFWGLEKDTLMVLATGALHGFITDNNPSRDELVAYKKGQADIALFFARCYKESEDKQIGVGEQA